MYDIRRLPVTTLETVLDDTLLAIAAGPGIDVAEKLWNDVIALQRAIHTQRKPWRGWRDTISVASPPEPPEPPATYEIKDGHQRQSFLYNWIIEKK